MGQASGSLLYDIGAPVEWDSRYHWLIYDGAKKDEKDENDLVSIFKFVKSSNMALVPLAQRNVQRLRTIRHPYVISFIDSSVLEDSIVLVTERAIPLDIWISNMQSMIKSQDPSCDELSLRNDILWGIQCISTALDFLHSKCKICHSNICMQSIFVVRQGDWKINAFDYSTQIGSAEDTDSSFSSAGISREYLPPERLKSDGPGSYEGDIYSFGKLISNIFATFRITVPTELDRFLKRMMSVEPKRRPSASAIMACSDLSSDFIVRLKSFADIALKTPLETQDIFQKITESANQYSKTISTFKIIIPLAQKMKIAFSEFSNRDSRESSRQTVQTALNLLSVLIDHGKVDESVFLSKCVPVLNDLWSMSDRTVRHALLKCSKSLLSMTPIAIVNKNVFDSMLAGFADSNAKMREETLKNLVFIVDKLDEKNLQDRLVRCITNLQNDGENSIRTNSTIFLGRIASKLKENTRQRVLCQAFAKSMRDNFSHCRIAGLKSAIACIDMIDAQQLSTVLLPQACVILVDRNIESRQLAMNFVESSIRIMKRHHEELAKIPVVDKDKEDKTAKTESGQTSAWTSWAVEGLSKTFERVTTTTQAENKSTTLPAMPSTESLRSNGSAKSTDLQQTPKVVENVSLTSKVSAQSSIAMDQADDVDMDQMNSAWEDDDFDWSDNIDIDKVDHAPIPPKQAKPLVSSTTENVSSAKIARASVAEKSPPSTPYHEPMHDSKTIDSQSDRVKSREPVTTKTTSKKAVKLSAKKLDVSNDGDNWDDF